MSKDFINRKDVKCDLLKRVIIRVDYQGMINAERWVENLMPLYKNNFLPCVRKYLTTDFSNQERIREVSEIYGKTRRSLRDEPLFSFKAGKVGKRTDVFSIDISSFFTVFYIECKNYSYIDEYLDFISEYVKKLCKFDEFVAINRIGIRKINGKVYEKADDIYSDFEKYIMFANPVDLDVFYEGQMYRDSMYREDMGIKVNFVRQCRNVSRANKDMVQVLLDIDAYMTEEEMTLKQYQMPRDADEVFNILNEYIFFLFKNSVNENYINGHKLSK